MSPRRDASQTAHLSEAQASVVEELPSAPGAPLPHRLGKVVNATATALRIVVGTLIVALLLVLTWNIAVRLLNISGYDIPTEIIDLGFTWMVFLGAAVLVHDWDHIEVPVLLLLVKGVRSRLLAHGVITLLSLVVSVAVTYSGWKLLQASSGRSSPMLHLPTPLWYASVLVGFGLITISLSLRLASYAHQLTTKQRADP